MPKQMSTVFWNSCSCWSMIQDLQLMQAVYKGPKVAAPNASVEILCLQKAYATAIIVAQKPQQRQKLREPF